LRRRHFSDLTLALTTYPPGQVYPWHVHELPTLFIPLAGRHRDETRRSSFDQPPLSTVFHPTTGPHTTAIGPGGLIGLNLALPDAWLDHRCPLRRRDPLAEYRLVDSPWARLSGLRMTAAACEPDEAAEADAETAVLELLSDLVLCATPSARVPRWLPRAEEFLRANSHTPVR